MLQDRVSLWTPPAIMLSMGVHNVPRMASLMGVFAHFGDHARWVLVPSRSFDTPAADRRTLAEGSASRLGHWPRLAVAALGVLNWGV